MTSPGNKVTGKSFTGDFAGQACLLLLAREWGPHIPVVHNRLQQREDLPCRSLELPFAGTFAIMPELWRSSFLMVRKLRSSALATMRPGAEWTILRL